MKRLIFLIGLIYLSTPLQSYCQDFSQIDNTLLLYPDRFERPEDLAAMIDRDFNTDLEKVRAVYGWIIAHIAYDPGQYEEFDFSFRDYKERNKKQQKKREAVIRTTIKKGLAVCEGYAMLFERLCELLGIENYLVRGQAKSIPQDIGSTFDLNHLWNVAYIDGQPYLFDTTWGAGRYTDRFLHEPDYFYFMIDPLMLIRSHYPEVPSDSLLEEPISADQFADLPLFLNRDVGINDIISPFSGIIDAQSARGLVSFQLVAGSAGTISYSFGEEKYPLPSRKVGEILYFQVKLPEKSPRQLVIYFDGKPALAYRIER